MNIGQGGFCRCPSVILERLVTFVSYFKPNEIISVQKFQSNVNEAFCHLIICGLFPVVILQTIWSFIKNETL